MHVTVKTTDFNVMDILKKYCDNNKIVFDSLIIDNRCILTIKEPSSDTLRAVSRLAKNISQLVDIKVHVYVDKAKEPINIDDLDI